MNKKFTKLIAALALLVFMTPTMAGWGQTSSSVTMAYSGSTTTNMTGNNDAALVGLDATDWSVVGAKGSNSNFPGLNKAGDIRLYYHQDGSNTITVTALNDNFTISNIVITYTSSDYNNGKVFVGDNEVTLSNGAYAINSTSFVVTNGNTSNVQVRISNIVISYTSGGGTTTYTVSFDCDGGTGCPEDITGIEEGDDNFTVPSVTPTKEHYEFDGFYIGSDDEMYEPGKTYTIESDLELTASWTINKNNVTLNDDNTAAELYAEYGDNMLNEGETVAINYGTELALNAESLPANHIVVWTVKNTSNEDVTADVLSGTTVTVPDYAIIITGTVTEIPTYTISFDAGTGTTVSSISGLDGSTITLPTTTPSEACASRGWEFAGWATASVSETTTAPTLLNGQYTITGNATFYAVYQVMEGDGGSFEYVFSEQGYQNAQTVYSATMDATSGIGWAATDGHSGNNTYEPKYYSTGAGLRVYNGGTFKVTANNKTITAVSLTFADGYTFTSNASNPTTWSGSQSTDITWNVSQTCRLQKVNVTYGSSTTTYNSTPSCFPMVATPTFTPAEGTYTGTQNVSIECDTDGATILYKTAEDGEWQTYSDAISVSTTTTIWAKATKNEMDDSEVAEATYTIQYTLTDGIENVTDYYLFDYHDEIWDDITPDENGHALVSSGAEVRISGGLAEDCYTLQGFYVVYGGNDTIEATYITEDGDNYYSFLMPASDAMLKAKTNRLPQHTLTIGTLSNVTLVLTAGEASDTVISGDELCEGINVTIAATPANSYVMESVSVVYGNNNQPVEVTFEGTNDGEYIYSFEMPTGNVTITATAVYNPIATATLSSSNMANMTSDGEAYGNLKYITVNGLYWESNGQQAHPSGGSTYGMLQLRTRTNSAGVSYIKLPTLNGKIESITLTVTNGNATSSDGGACKAILAFQAGVTSSESVIVSGGDSNNGTNEITLDLSNTFYSTGYITVTGSNAARIWNIDVTYRLYQDMTGNTLETIGNDATVSIPAGANVTAENLTIPASSGIIINSGATLTVGTLTNSGNANNIIVKDGGQLIFYAVGTETREGNDVKATVEKNIAAWTEGSTGGWYFIASPINVNNLNSSTVTNMLPDDEEVSGETVRNYDLYWLDNTMWRNYRQNSFNLANGQGYLYARSKAATLEFAGAIKPYSTANNANQVAVSAGWNLIGNPYTFKAYPNTAYYTINDANTGIIATTETSSGAVDPCTGILVNVDADDYVTFSDEAPSKSNNGNLNLVVAQAATNRGTAATLDNAIVSFNEGNKLEKFYFMQQNANLYIPQGTEEYAIVSSEAQGTMPVNFRANENGQYTLTVNPENVEMNYLHLIDNMTGADIDLLQTPSYSFNATTNDYESRFKLVFATNGASTSSATDETFAFYSNGNWVINNAGEATLQVVDITGRILSSETVNGSVSKAINATPGVYMLRLINGENVKVQKVVIE